MGDVRGSPTEVLRVFARLGVTSFGGPIAHLGYFRDEFVTRRRWIDDVAYADLVALCQFLPGPASSQVGFSIGLSRAGYLGGLAAWTGFTLPSAIALTTFAYGASRIQCIGGDGLLHGLKLVALAIVAQAVLGMTRSLCPDPRRASIAAVALLGVSVFGGSFSQLAVILFGAVAELVVCRPNTVSADYDGGASPCIAACRRWLPCGLLRVVRSVVHNAAARDARAVRCVLSIGSPSFRWRIRRAAAAAHGGGRAGVGCPTGRSLPATGLLRRSPAHCSLSQPILGLRRTSAPGGSSVPWSRSLAFSCRAYWLSWERFRSGTPCGRNRDPGPRWQA